MFAWIERAVQASRTWRGRGAGLGRALFARAGSKTIVARRRAIYGLRAAALAVRALIERAPRESISQRWDMGVVEFTPAERLYAEIWTKQSELLWRLVTALPVVQLALAAGAYTLDKEGHTQVSAALGVFGVIVMWFATMVIRRTGDLLVFFTRRAGPFLVNAPPFPISGRVMGQLLGILCIATNVFLIFMPRFVDFSLPAMPSH